MRKSGHHSLTTLSGAAYILPFGQGAADRRSGVKLDETGVFLWNALDSADSFDGLLKLYMEHEGCPDTDELRKRLTVFLDELKASGIIIEGEGKSVPYFGTLSIAGIRVRLFGPERYFSKELEPFLTSGSDSFDQTVTVTEAMMPELLDTRVLFNDSELTVCESSEGFLLYYPQNAFLRFVSISRDGSAVRMFVRGSYTQRAVTTLSFELFNALNCSFLYLAQRRGYFALSAASIQYCDKAWLFCGSSDAGKSAQVELWRKNYAVNMLNGELALLSDNGDGTIMFHGMPWCGASGVTTRRSLPLGGVILLRSGLENKVEALSDDAMQLMTAESIISPVWTEEMLRLNIDFTGKLIKNAAVWRYTCTKELAAAAVMKAAVDRYVRRE